MGTVISNLKAKFGVDTSDFKKGLKEGESAIKDFKGAAGNKLDEFAAIFGVNMQAVNNSINLAGKSLGFLEKSFKGAASGGNYLAIAMKILQSVILASGVGALVLLLGSLIAYFGDTERGARQLSGAMAQIKVVGTVLKEHLATLGEAFVSLIRGKGIAEFWSKLKEAFSGIAKEVRELSPLAKANDEAVYQLTKAERTYNEYKSEQMILLDQYRLKARDLDLSAQERLDNLVKAGEVEKDINLRAKAIASEKLFIAKVAQQIDKESEEKKDALSAATVEYNRVCGESILFDISQTREKNKLIKEIGNQLEAQKKLNDISFAAGSNGVLPGLSTIQANLDKISKTLKPIQINFEASHKSLTKILGDVQKAVEAALAQVAVDFGEFLGNLMAGTGNIRDFTDAVISSFAELAITIGKIAITSAIAVSGISQMLKNPVMWPIALAAGVALVAIGTAVKGALSNAASGGGSRSSYTSAGSYTFDTRLPKTNMQQPQTINIQGELVARNGTLSAVIKHEANLKATNT